MNLIVDSGNTNVKAGLFADGQLQEVYRQIPLSQLLELIKKTAPENLLISSVSDLNPDRFQFPSVKKMLVMRYTLPMPIQILYKTPETLGTDRIAGAVAAKMLFPDLPCLVIDAGTCITYNFVNAQSHYFGGAISPGVKMRFKALNTFTARLPLVEMDEKSSLIGGNTRESIISGVVNGVVAEVEGIIARYRTEFPEIKILVTGGDATFFETKIKEPIFVVPDLVLKGLNRILEYNI
ncbi:MAG TPA: type III pantothenate kinase [Cytophagaceae bacterium]